MPTTITRYVNPASTGGDGTTSALSGASAAYASLSAALAAQGRNLVTADEIALFKCAGSTTDTTPVAAADWASYVMDATRYAQIEADAGQSQQHGGAWNTGVYRLETTNATALSFATAAGAAQHVRVRGLQVRSIATTGSTGRAAIRAPSGVSVNSIADVRGCILRMSKTGGTGTTHKGFSLEDGQWATAYCANNLVLLDGTDVGTAIIRTTTGTSLYIHNCGVVGATVAYSDGANSTTNTVQVKNCWSKGCTTFSEGAGIENSDYNSTDLATATGGANDRVSQTFTFVDEGNGDYRPASDDAAIRGHGVDLSADANLPITTDMEGVTVNSPPDIGPLTAEVVEEEGSDNRWVIRRAAA